MAMKQIFDEEAFYGYVSRFYFLEGNNLRELFDKICGNFLENSSNSDHYTFINVEEKIFSEGEIRVKAGYNYLPPDGIYIDLMSFIGGVLLLDREVNLVRLVESIADENKFKLIREDINQF